MPEFCADGHLICPNCGEHIPPALSGSEATHLVLGLIGGLRMLGLIDAVAVDDIIERFKSDTMFKALRMMSSPTVQGQAAAFGEQMRRTVEQAVEQAADKPEPEPD